MYHEQMTIEGAQRPQVKGDQQQNSRRRSRRKKERASMRKSPGQCLPSQEVKRISSKGGRGTGKERRLIQTVEHQWQGARRP